jgi:transposase
VEQKLKSTESYWHRQKWLIVYNGLVDPRPASAIAKQTGVSVGTVHKVSSQYNQLGVAALETPGKGGNAATPSKDKVTTDPMLLQKNLHSLR